MKTREELLKEMSDPETIVNKSPFLDISGVADDELDIEGDSYCSIDENGNMIYGSFSDGYDVSCNEMPIKFCPMCGRKLGDE